MVLDPKGENYRETAWRRSLFGQVFKWAPFEADSDSYNPLDFVHDWDDARLLADLVVVNSGRDLFWDTAARNLLTGLIMYVITTRPTEKRNMREVCRVLAAGQDERDDMIRTLQGSDDDNLADLGNRIASQEDRLKESIYESLNAQLDVWRSKGIVATTSVTTPGFSMEEIPQVDHTGVRMAEGMGDPPGWRQKEDGTVILGSAATVYIVIPPDKIGSYRSVLRVLLGQMLKVAMRTYDDIARRAEEYPDADTDPMRRWWPMMFLLDEFPQLGYMAPIEEAISTARSYKVRLWLFAQNLSQLSRVYTNWQTIMSGCRAQIFFRPNDMETAAEISNRIGRRKDIWGGDDWAATPQALMSPEYRDDCIIFMPNVRPIRALLYTALHANDSFQQEVAEWRRDFGEEVRRAPRPEQVPVAPDAPDIIPDSAVKPPPDGNAMDDEPGEFDDDEEYQREVAEAKRRAEERRRAKNDGAPKPPTFGGVARLERTKNKERRTLPLTHHALAVMLEHHEHEGRPTNGWVFPREDGMAPMEIRKQWEAALRSAGITNFRFHDLRHSAASYLAMNGASLAEIAEVLGHKTLQMVKRYAHLSDQHVAGVVERMNKAIFREPANDNVATLPRAKRGRR